MLVPSRWSVFVGTLLVLFTAGGAAVSEESLVNGRRYVQRPNGLFVVDRNGSEWAVAEGIMVVRFSAQASLLQLGATAEAHGLTKDPYPPNSAGYSVYYFEPSRNPLTIAADLLRDPIVLDAYPDTEIKSWGTHDPYYANQWNMRKMRFDRVWEITTGSPSVTIAVIDRGIDYWHEDLTNSRWLNPLDDFGDGVDDDNDSSWFGAPLIDDFTGWDFVSGDNQPLPGLASDRHGTSVAGIIFGERHNDVGVAGALGAQGNSGPRLMSLRGSVVAAHVVKAIEYAWRKRATIINMSFGVWDDSTGAVAAQIDSAVAHGVIVVAAAGNDGNYLYPQSQVAFPARHPAVIAVGATDSTDVRWGYSCNGQALDLMASSGTYGVQGCWTTDNRTGGHNPDICLCPLENPWYYSEFGGTSTASPEVATVAALLKSRMPQLTVAQVRQRLIDSAVDLGDAGFDTLYGYGRADAYRALTEWGTISGNITWSPSDTHDGTRYISGDLTIAPGATLTIMPGTIIKIANDDDLLAAPDTARVEIKVQGTLVANGTASDPIIFDSWHPTTTADWAGIYFDNQSGGGTFNHCVIKRAERAIESYVPLAIRNSQIDSCSYAGVVSLDGGAFIRSCTFTDPGVFGAFLANDGSVIRETIIDGATTAGCHLESGAALTFRQSTVANSGTGLYVDGTASVDVDSTCYVWTNDTGFHFYNNASLSTIKSCGITWNASTAVLCDNSSPRIEANTFAHNGGGIYCSNSSAPVIESNKMQTSGNVVTATSLSSPDVGHSSPGAGQSAGYNKIAHSTKYVANYTAATILAQNNCWNINTPPCNPPSSRFTGSVDWSDPDCCSFPLFSHGEGEPEPSELVFELPPASPDRSGKPPITGLIAIVPNPFNPTTAISYSLAARGNVEINVYDVGGRLVRVLKDETMVAGQHSAIWNGTDGRGSPVASGVYFVRMTAAGQVFTRKMVLLK